jgi:hypothetical protein
MMAGRAAQNSKGSRHYRMPGSGAGSRSPKAAPEIPRCRLKHLAWARLFGLPDSAVRSPTGRKDLCDRVSEAIPVTSRANYRVHKLLNRGAYGVVFVAHNRRADLPWAALKVQFVCPSAAKKDRDACAGFGQRASAYSTVRYESMQHQRVFDLLQAARAVPSNKGLPLPAVPKPIASSRMIVGRKGQYPRVPPDGRRRLWVSLMEYMPARSVRQTMLEAKRTGTLTAAGFEDILRGIAKHLRVFHELGVTHGDLHTGNVLLDQARAAEGKPWVVFVDLERSIPREFMEQSPLVKDAEHAEALWDVARLWDLKLLIESVVRLAESAGIYRPESSRPPQEERPASNSQSPESSYRSSQTAASAEERFRRGVRLALVVLSAYMGRRGEPNAWMQSVAGAWTARSLWLKNRASPSALPREVAEPLGGADEVLRGDRHEHRAFFDLLRHTQAFYTAPRRAGPRRLEGLDPGAILPAGAKRRARG